jgi:nucleoside 2-deoxyribosyltransferase
MAYDSRVYRVLIASPSDVLEEREAAVRVMQDWNNLHSDNRRVVVLPLRWETHTAPEYNMRPQEAVNRRIVDDCDLLVGIFWTRLGTPTGEADSGTLEEIERVAKAGKPVMLYFSHVPVDPNQVDLDQMEKLKNFKERISPNALVETFGSSLNFRDKFANQLELKIRDLQKADNIGQPLPLDLQFVSLETGELAGNSLSISVDALELSDPNIPVVPELKQYFERVFQNACIEATLVPVILAIKNISSSGVRNLYVEMSITGSAGAFQVSETNPLGSFQYSTATYYFSLAKNLYVSEPSEIERKLQKLSSEGLRKEGGGWKYSFEWDALQPHRIRVVQPFIYLLAPGACKAEFRAKVYADSFPNPIVLYAEIAVAVQPKLLKTDIVVAKAKELLEAEKRNVASVVTVGAGTNKLFIT